MQSMAQQLAKLGLGSQSKADKVDEGRRKVDENCEKVSHLKAITSPSNRKQKLPPLSNGQERIVQELAENYIARVKRNSCTISTVINELLERYAKKFQNVSGYTNEQKALDALISNLEELKSMLSGLTDDEQVDYVKNMHKFPFFHKVFGLV
jgi:uncharacterized phage infection (PIP) family protein YhgE